MEIYDKIIIGAGIYGLYSAHVCSKKGQRILILERDENAFMRATYINQARVHMGYHYPRSKMTALKSAHYFQRFCDDYGFCIKRDFKQIYATSAALSWTNAIAFQKFCDDSNIPCERINEKEYFREGLCDGAFLTEEFTYDAMILRNYFLEELSKSRCVDILFNQKIESINQDNNNWKITSCGETYISPFILNATYAGINEIQKMMGFETFNIKYELCEIILCEVDDKLKDVGLTVMDGPFFSIMPFGKTGYHSLAYSILLVPNAISWWVMNTSDRLMLTGMIGASFTGIYSVACKFPSIMNAVHSLFYQAWQEQAVLEYDAENRDVYYTKIFNTYMKLSFCLIILLIPLTKVFINLFMSESYKISYEYVSILYLASLFSSFSSFYGTGYISAKDPKNATITTTIGAITNCLINLLFIKLIGVWAACISTLVGYVIVYLIRVFQTRKYFHISLELKSFIVLLIISVIYSGFVIFADWRICILMSVVAMGVLYAFNRHIIMKGFMSIKKKIMKSRQ